MIQKPKYLKTVQLVGMCMQNDPYAATTPCWPFWLILIFAGIVLLFFSEWIIASTGQPGPYEFLQKSSTHYH